MKDFEIEISPEKEFEIIDITERIKSFVKESRVNNGLVIIFSKHTTTGIKINEKESGLLEDIKWALDSLIPKHRDYLHNESDERSNANSHLKALLLNTSETIPIINSELALGTWQSILFFDLDGKNRKRKIVVQIIESN